jgi:thioredoxin reductase (NADPH)
MHQAGIINETMGEYSSSFGFDFKKQNDFNWNTLTNNISKYIKSIQFGVRSDYRKNKIQFKNAFGRFIDSSTVEIEEKGVVKHLRANHIVIACGGRPLYPSGKDSVPGAQEYGITSDDLFSLKTPPNNTLIIGGSYIALESASFLTSLGYDTTVMIRSIPLRGFDEEISSKIISSMKKRGTKFLENSTLKEIQFNAPNDYKVVYNGDKIMNKVNTVMFAIGRRGLSKELNLENIGMKLDKNDKIVVDSKNETSINNIYAIGDISTSMELTPVAIYEGSLLAKRLYSKEVKLMDYHFIPTTIFTSPLEYGCCGLTEQEAIKRFGKENIEVYHSSFTPLEWKLKEEDQGNECYLKMICNKLEEERVIGFHLLSPNAGEILQGVSVSMKLGAKKMDFDETIGIHPTIAEEMTINRVTKSSGDSFDKGSC